jgi:preprotein translocase subunit SecE
MAETTRTGVKDFLAEVGEQVRKVTWPDKQQLKNSTGIIVVFVLLVAAVIFGMDWILRIALGVVRGLFTGGT